MLMFTDDDFARLTITAYDVRAIPRKRLVPSVIAAALTAVLFLVGATLMFRSIGAGDMHLLDLAIMLLKFSLAAAGVTLFVVMALVIDLKILKASKGEETRKEAS